MPQAAPQSTTTHASSPAAMDRRSLIGLGGAAAFASAVVARHLQKETEMHTQPIGSTGAQFIAAPFIAGAAGLAGEHDDDELLELGHQYETLLARADALTVKSDAAAEAAHAHYPPCPEALRIRPSDHPITNVDLGARRVGEFMDYADVGRWRKNADMGWVLSPGLREQRLARRAEILAAWDGWFKARERVFVAFGVPALQEETDAACIAVTELEHRIFGIRAKTAEGWRLKAKIARGLFHPPPGEDREGWTYEEHMLDSILTDLAA